MTLLPTDPQQLRQHLDELADRGTRFLSRWSVRRDVRLALRQALWFLLAPPIAIGLARAGLTLSGAGPIHLPLWLWPILTLAGPPIFVVARVGWLAVHRRIDRRVGLGLFDAELASNDRLVAADEFLVAPLPLDAPTDHFKLAAIDDAAPYIARALMTPLTPHALPSWAPARRSWAAVPASAIVLLGAFLMGDLSANGRGVDSDATTLIVQAGSQQGRTPLTLSPSTPPNPPRPRAFDREHPAASVAQPSSEPSTRSHRTDRDADGQSHVGGQANSRSSSHAMSSSGTPSSQQAPSKAVDEDDLPERNTAAQQLPKPADKKQAELQAMSATTGQGESKSSTSDTNMVPASDQPDRAGAHKDDGPDEGGIQDEVEEEKTAGVERPSLRRNKPPVDRNLSPMPTGDQPSPLSNGRSGPGSRKKTRGVPAMILGIPTPDRIQGMSHPGRSKVTQEHSTPREERQTPIAAEARWARDRPFGSVEHPLLRPWMQDLIETYFMQLRVERSLAKETP